MPRDKYILACPVCNGCHEGYQTGDPCPRRLHVDGRYFRVLSIEEFARRRRACYRTPAL